MHRGAAEGLRQDAERVEDGNYDVLALQCKSSRW